MSVTYYQLLGVAQDATTEEIRSAWRRAMRTVHSDVGGDDRQAQVVNEAYATLRDPRRRQRYDADLARAAHRNRPTARSCGRAAEPDWTAEYEWDGETDWDEETDQYEEPTREPERAHEEPRNTGEPARRPEKPPEWHPPRPPSWLGQLDTSAPLRAHPPPGLWRRVFFLAAGICAAADLAFAIRLAQVDTTGALSGLLILFLVPARRRAMRVLGVLIVVLCAAGGVVLLTRPGDRLPGLLLLLLVAGTCVAGLLGQVWLRHRDVDRLVGRETTYGRTVFGVPGEGLSEGMVAKRNGSADAWTRERRAAELLAAVLAIPGATVFHAVPLPGERRVWVDHVVVCGDRVALVDNRYWPPGRYDADEYGVARRDGTPVTGSVASLDQAVEAWRRHLPRALVHGFCVVWSTGEPAVTATGAGPRFTFAATDTAADVVGSWLLPGAGTVHRTLVHAVLTAAV